MSKTDATRRALAGSYLLVGGADFRLRDFGSTEKYYLEAVRLREELAKPHSTNAAVQSELGLARQRSELAVEHPTLAAIPVAIVEQSRDGRVQAIAGRQASAAAGERGL